MLKDYGAIDVLVNAAGIFEYSGALEGEALRSAIVMSSALEEQHLSELVCCLVKIRSFM